MLVCSPSYSYSEVETFYGQTTNASEDAVRWVMTNLVPQQTQLNIDSVFYRYTVDKEEEDAFKVTIQNENAIDGGYIFRNTDDWTGLPGNTITDLIPVNSIPIEYWGEGSIETEGEGEVSDPTVVYSYRYTEIQPEAPDIPEPEVYNPLDNQFVQDQIDREAVENNEEEEEQERKAIMARKKKDDEEVDLQSFFGIGSPLENAEVLQKYKSFSGVSFSQPYGVVYEETMSIADKKKLPDGPNIRVRDFRLQRQNDAVHKEMMRLQFQK